MNTTIWKFALTQETPVSVGVDFPIRMPAGATLRYVDMQRNALYLWAEVDPDAELEERAFTVRGTGHWIFDAERFNYVGTCQQEFVVFGTSQMDYFVWHVYERVD